MTVVLEHAACSSCGRDTAHLRRDLNHAFHLVGALFSFGLWGIVWAARFVGLDRTWFCVCCGTARAGFAFERAWDPSRGAGPREAEVEP